jgi:hypothetical protein
MAGKTVGQLREALEKVSKRREFGDSADKEREAKGPNNKWFFQVSTNYPQRKRPKTKSQTELK